MIAVLLLTVFGWNARLKGDSALIDLRLFGGKIFSTAAVTQFLSNGVVFAGQVLIPIYLVRAGGRSPSEMGWLMAPLGLGMMCTYASMGALTRRFGIRGVCAGGALLALVGTLPFLDLASQHLDTVVLVPALFVRGAGLSAVGIPSLSAAYASVTRQDLPMATAALNIVQRAPCCFLPGKEAHAQPDKCQEGARDGQQRERQGEDDSEQKAHRDLLMASRVGVRL